MIGRCGLILSVWLAATAAPSLPLARIAIIIDDLGYQLEAGRRSINLPGPVTCAILPSTPRATKLAEAAFANGKDVLLHLPLEPVSRDSQPDPGGILLDMSRDQFAMTSPSANGTILSLCLRAGLTEQARLIMCGSNRSSYQLIALVLSSAPRRALCLCALAIPTH